MRFDARNTPNIQKDQRSFSADLRLFVAIPINLTRSLKVILRPASDRPFGLWTFQFSITLCRHELVLCRSESAARAGFRRTTSGSCPWRPGVAGHPGLARGYGQLATI